jgi:predicted DNA-binding helix-hairpin-helix protein
MAIKFDDLKKMGVVIKRAKYFLTCGGKFYGDKRMEVGSIKLALNPPSNFTQTTIFDNVAIG